MYLNSLARKHNDPIGARFPPTPYVAKEEGRGSFYQFASSMQSSSLFSTLHFFYQCHLTDPFTHSLSCWLVRSTIERIDLLGNVGESDTSLAVVLSNGLGLVREHVHLKLLALGSHSRAVRASEEVGVLLLWEVHVIVSVRMRVLGWVVPVVLVERVRPE